MTVLRHAFAHPWLLTILLAFPLLAALGAWGRRKRRQALLQLGDVATLETQMSGRRGWRSRLRGLCLSLGLLGLGLSAAGPQWGRDWDQSAAPGRDLVVVLDCSRSMLAETPSRLERARAALIDLSEAVEKRGGHRLALVLVAGRARLVCPLTHDYDHFRTVLADVESAAQERGLEPGKGETSGTRLGQGLSIAALADDSRFQGARDILLLSDGDDPARDGEWRAGARIAAAQGIRVHTVGIGDPDTPSVIRLDAGPLTHDGKVVRTRLEEAPLREIAEMTQGTYTPAHTRTLPLGAIYLDSIRAQPLREESDDALPVYQQRYPWLLGPALGLLAVVMLLSDGAVRGRRLPYYPLTTLR